MDRSKNRANVRHVVLGVIISSMLLLTSVLEKQNLSALTSGARYTSGFSHGEQQAAADFQNNSTFNPVLNTLVTTVLAILRDIALHGITYRLRGRHQIPTLILLPIIPVVHILLILTKPLPNLLVLSHHQQIAGFHNSLYLSLSSLLLLQSQVN